MQLNLVAVNPSLLLVMLHLLFHFALDLGKVGLFVFFFLGGLNLSHLIFEVLLVEPGHSLAVLP